jgi:hypothetical protein
MWFGNGQSFFLQTVEMKGARVLHLPLNLILGSSRRDASGKVGRVSRVQHTVQRPWREIVARLPGDRDESRFRRVLELSMRTARRRYRRLRRTGAGGAIHLRIERVNSVIAPLASGAAVTRGPSMLPQHTICTRGVDADPADRGRRTASTASADRAAEGSRRAHRHDRHPPVERPVRAGRSWSPLSPLPFRGSRGSQAQPILASDSTLGIAVLGAGVAQLSLADRKWNIRAQPRTDITAFAKDNEGRYWLGTRGGVWRLSADGSEWRLVPTGLDGDISAVAVDPDGYLLAAVTGRGMFRARLP